MWRTPCAPVPPGPRRQLVCARQLLEHCLVVDGVDDDADVGVVLRRRPHHGRPADVDHLDARLVGERVQVDDHEVDGLDAVRGHVVDVGGIVGISKEAPVHLRVQRDHAVAEDRGDTGQLGDVGDGQPGVGQYPGRAPLDTSAHPRSWSRRARSTTPVLS